MLAFPRVPSSPFAVKDKKSDQVSKVPRVISSERNSRFEFVWSMVVAIR
jgi:hypothetical protein